jgi:hypothetical protein
MARNRTLYRLLPLVACLAGCGGKVDRPTFETLPDGRSLVRVWVQDHQDLDVDTMIDGCGVWWPEKFVCEREKVAAQADVQVYADDGPCVKEADGHFTLATSYHDAVIVFNVKCFDRNPDGSIALRELHGVMGHEIGHEIGVWDHVPPTCMGGEKVASDGERVCGIALMNPDYNGAIDSMTWEDQLAYETRAGSPSRPAPDPDGVPDLSPLCAYRSR